MVGVNHDGGVGRREQRPWQGWGCEGPWVCYQLGFPPKVWEPTAEFSAAWARFVRLFSIVARASGSR